MSEHNHEHEHECCGKHDHSKGEGCGCGGHHHDHDLDGLLEEQLEYITITSEAGEEVSCAILGTFDVETIEEKEFMALLPDDGKDEVLIFSFMINGEELILDPLLEEHFEAVANEFKKLYGEENFED